MEPFPTSIILSVNLLRARQIQEQINETRRSFFTATALVAATSVLKAQEKKVDGGLAAIEDKKIPKRSTPLTLPAH